MSLVSVCNGLASEKSLSSHMLARYLSGVPLHAHVIYVCGFTYLFGFFSSVPLHAHVIYVYGFCV
jgi:hypothetical protein